LQARSHATSTPTLAPPMTLGSQQAVWPIRWASLPHPETMAAKPTIQDIESPALWSSASRQSQIRESIHVSRGARRAKHSMPQRGQCRGKSVVESCRRLATAPTAYHSQRAKLGERPAVFPNSSRPTPASHRIAARPLFAEGILRSKDLRRGGYARENLESATCQRLLGEKRLAESIGTIHHPDAAISCGRKMRSLPCPVDGRDPKTSRAGIIKKHKSACPWPLPRLLGRSAPARWESTGSAPSRR